MSPLFISGLMQGIGLLQGMQVMQPGFQGATHGMCLPELMPGSPPPPPQQNVAAFVRLCLYVCLCVYAFVCVGRLKRGCACVCVCVRACVWRGWGGAGSISVPGVTQGVDVQAHQGKRDLLTL
jgi:hypothetical protein